MSDLDKGWIVLAAWTASVVSGFFLVGFSKERPTGERLPGKVVRQIRLKHKVSELSTVVYGLHKGPYYTREDVALVIQLAEARAELEILTRELEGKDLPPPSGV